MATMLIPIDPPVTSPWVTRVPTISASLLPEEIIAGRRARRSRAWVIVAVILVVCLLATWYVFAARAARAADAELTSALTEVTDLKRDQAQYTEVVTVQNSTTTISAQLKAVMANDLDWAALLDTLRTTGAKADIKVVGISGLLKLDEQAADPAATLPSTNEATAIGSLVVTGTGPDKEAVAAYADTLNKESTVANPYVTSVTTLEKNSSKVDFSLNLDITQAALCGRFGDKCKAGGN
jgi:hypothetical protein